MRSTSFRCTRFGVAATELGDLAVLLFVPVHRRVEISHQLEHQGRRDLDPRHDFLRHDVHLLSSIIAAHLGRETHNEVNRELMRAEPHANTVGVDALRPRLRCAYLSNRPCWMIFRHSTKCAR